MFHFSHLSEYQNLVHFISNRRGGVSESSFSSLNISQLVGDEEEKVYQNRQILARNTGFLHSNGILPQLTHGKKVKIVNNEHAGRGWANQKTAILDTDALITQEKELCLIVTLADCTPILLFDPQKQVIAAIHSGWKGTILGIVQETIQIMKKSFGCIPKDIIAGIGVSIGACCYEVSEEMAKQFIDRLGEQVVTYKEKKPYLDLWKSNEILLLQSGVLPENIEIARLCSSCEVENYFSHRKEKGKTGRFCAGIMLKKGDNAR